MKIMINVLMLIIVLLSFAAGFAKVSHSAQEVEFLQSFGFNNLAILLYGILQILSALILAVGAVFSIKGARPFGASAIALCFFVSSVLIFISGAFVFALLSLIPVVISIILIKPIGAVNKTEL